MALTMMRGEMRRHFTMNCCLIAAGVVASTAITNERGVFSPIGFNPFSATAQAFEALAGHPIGALRPFGGVPAVVPLGGRPGAPGPLRRGLVNSLIGVPPADAIGSGPFEQGSPVGPTTLLPQEVVPGLGGGGLPSFVPTPGPGPATVPNSQTLLETPPVTPVPEPALWMSLILGLGGVGGALRRAGARRRRAALMLEA